MKTFGNVGQSVISRERFALRHILQDVDHFERVAEAVEELDGFEREAAARRRLRPFAVYQDRILRNFARNFFFVIHYFLSPPKRSS